MDETPTLQQILDNLKRQVAILADRVDMFITHHPCSSPSTPAAITPISPPSTVLNPSSAPSSILKTTTTNPISSNIIPNNDSKSISKPSEPNSLDRPDMKLLSDPDLYLPHSQPTNIQALQLEKPKPQIGDSDLNDDQLQLAKLLSDPKIRFPDNLEAVLETDPFQVYSTTIKGCGLNCAKTGFDILFKLGCCLTVEFCNAWTSSFVKTNRASNARNMFVDMTKSYFIRPRVSGSKPLIFDPGGKSEFESLFVARFMQDEAQPNHNPSSTILTSLRPTYDLEDKVDLEEVGIDTYTTIPSVQEGNTTRSTRSQRAIRVPRRFLE